MSSPAMRGEEPWPSGHKVAWWAMPWTTDLAACIAELTIGDGAELDENEAASE